MTTSPAETPLETQTAAIEQAWRETALVKWAPHPLIIRRWLESYSFSEVLEAVSQAGRGIAKEFEFYHYWELQVLTALRENRKAAAK